MSGTTALSKNGLKRDNWLDFIKGIAAINIILIHTTFWSGGGYVPQIVQSLSLVLDVPFFSFVQV